MRRRSDKEPAALLAGDETEALLGGAVGKGGADGYYVALELFSHRDDGV